MAEEQQKAAEPPLRLTDTPNVAQVIRIYKQLEREREARIRQLAWRRRLWVWLTFPFRRAQVLEAALAEKAEADATVVSINSAVSAKKRFDANGRAIVDHPGLEERGARVLVHSERGKHVAIDGLAIRPDDPKAGEQ